MSDTVFTGDDDYQWKYAFEAALEDIKYVYEAGPFGALSDPIDADDVIQVIATDVDDGSWAETSMRGVFKLKNGKYAFISAWCDTTGWDCQSGGFARVADSLEILINQGIPQEDRKILGLANDE